MVVVIQNYYSFGVLFAEGISCRVVAAGVFVVDLCIVPLRIAKDGVSNYEPSSTSKMELPNAHINLPLV